MGYTSNWFLIALVGMLSFAAMALTLKKLTYFLPTPLILLYMFAFTALLYFVYQLKTGTGLKINVSAILLLLLASAFAFIGNLCDVEALRLAPNAGYASAVKSGQILVITLVAYLMFADQKLSWLGALGVVFIFCGVVLLAMQK